jgi:hypothetical protein
MNLFDFDGEGINPWHPFIYKFHYDFTPILPEIRECYDKLMNHWATDTDLSPVESGDGHSTVRVGVYDANMQPHLQPFMDPFHAWLGPRIGMVWEKMGWMGANSEVSKSWFNRHNKGAKTLEHTHNGAELIVASYISIQPKQGYIQFRDPLEYHKTCFPYNVEKELWKTIETVTGDVLMFPGWLNHRTEENEVGGERICMTYNINVRLFKADVENKFRI